jgi:hypothetical protein
MDSFNREVCGELGAELLAAAKLIAAKHGLTVELDGGTISVSQYAPRLIFGAAPSGKSPEQWGFEQSAHLYGLKPEHWGREFFSLSGSPAHPSRIRYRIVGLDPERRTYPIVGERVAGARKGERLHFRSTVAKHLCHEEKVEEIIEAVRREEQAEAADRKHFDNRHED